MKTFLSASGFLGMLGLLNAAESGNPPSRVDNAITEQALPVLRLTSQAVQRLGIETSAVERKSLPNVRLYPGTVRIPLGGAADSLAPAPVSGAEELRRQAELQTAADGMVESARAALEVAAQARKRAEILSAAKAGSERVLDEAKAAELQAAAALAAAERSRALLGRPAADVAAKSERWIAVVLPSADLAVADLQRAASLRIPGTGKEKLQSAAPVARMSTALPGGSVEICYATSDATLPTGQLVEMQIPGRGDDGSPCLTVPWSSIIFDATGGTWIYERLEETSFARRRVSLQRVAGDTAILSSGPVEGTNIVSVGAAELFGAEFGGFK